MSVPMRWEHCAVPEPSPEPPRLRRRASRRSRLSYLVAGGALCAVLGGLAAVGAQSAWNAVRVNNDLQLITAQPSNGPAALGSAAVERRLGFVTVTGSVSNRSGHSLSQVEAVVELLDKQNRPLQLESGLIAFDPLPAGTSSSFRVELLDNVQAVAYRVRFKKLMGASLN